MICKFTKEEAAVLNVLSSQAYSLIMPPLLGALTLWSASNVSLCMGTAAPIRALLDHLLYVLIAHRQVHGEFKTITSLGILRKNPEVFMKLVGDLNELLSATMREIDPGNDYMFNLFKMEAKKK
jgi:hypothetical protein